MGGIPARSLGWVRGAPSAQAVAALALGLVMLLLASACATAPGRAAQASLHELERGADGILKAGRREPVLLEGERLSPGGAGSGGTAGEVMVRGASGSPGEWGAAFPGRNRSLAAQTGASVTIGASSPYSAGTAQCLYPSHFPGRSSAVG